MAVRISLLFCVAVVALAVVVPTAAGAFGWHRRGQSNDKGIKQGDSSSKPQEIVQVQNSDSANKDKPAVTQTSTTSANSAAAACSTEHEECGLDQKESFEKLIGRMNVFFSIRRMNKRDKAAATLRFMRATKATIRGSLKCSDTSRLMIDIDAIIASIANDAKNLPKDAKKGRDSNFSKRKPMTKEEREECVQKLMVPFFLGGWSLGTASGMALAAGTVAAPVVIPGVIALGLSAYVATNVFCPEA